MKKACIFIVLVLITPLLLISEDSWQKSLLKDIVTVKGNMFQINKGIILKNLQKKKSSYSYYKKQQPAQIRINLISEAPTKGVISRDNFLAYSTIAAFSNITYFIDSTFEGYVDKNLFYTNIDIQDLGEPFDYPDVEFYLSFSKDGVSGKITCPFIGYEKKFNVNWEEFWLRAERIAQQEKELEEKGKQVIEDLKNIKEWEDYSNEESQIAFKYPKGWLVKNKDEGGDNYYEDICSLYFPEGFEEKYTSYNFTGLTGVMLYCKEITLLEGESLDKYLKDNYYLSVLPETEKIGNYTWKKFSKDYTYSETKEIYYVYAVRTGESGRTILFIFATFGELGDDVNQAFKKIIETVKIL